MIVMPKDAAFMETAGKMLTDDRILKFYNQKQSEKQS